MAAQPLGTDSVFKNINERPRDTHRLHRHHRLRWVLAPYPLRWTVDRVGHELASAFQALVFDATLNVKSKPSGLSRVKCVTVGAVVPGRSR